MERKLVYLAVPYSDKDWAVKENRFDRVNQVAAILIARGENIFSPIARGENIFSPISMAHPIAKAGDLPGNWEFWDKFDRAYLECCKKMYVLMLDGWENSNGVKAEIKIAEELKIEIEYVDYEDIIEEKDRI